VTLEQPGTYSLTVTDAEGCTATDSFRLTQSNDLLHADFVMVTEAYTGDTVVIIDISWPIPEVVSWDFGTTAIEVLTENQDFAEVIFNETGTYTVTYTVNIETGLSDCIDLYGQAITILDGADKPDKGGRKSSEELIKSFTIYPNPSDGRFEVGVKLSETTAIKLMLIDLSGNKVISNLSLTGESDYQVPFTLPNVKKGIYMVKLDVGGSSRVRRVIVR